MNNPKGKNTIVTGCSPGTGAAIPCLQQAILCYHDWPTEYTALQPGGCLAAGIALGSYEL